MERKRGLSLILKNKKGATLDNIFTAVSFFGLAILFIALGVFWTQISSDPFWDESPTAQTAKADGQSLVDNFDFILVITYIGLHLGVIVLAYLLRTHPVVYVAGIILVLILTMISAPLSNVYEDISADADMSGFVATIPKTNMILANFPLFETVWGFATLIIMFGFARGEGML